MRRTSEQYFLASLGTVPVGAFRNSEKRKPSNKENVAHFLKIVSNRIVLSCYR